MKTHYPDIWHCRYRISAKAILRNSEWKFALCMKEMEVDGKFLTKWDIPWGGIDHGEDVFTTLRREIKEEMGLEVKQIEKQPQYFFIWESACWKVPLWLVFYEVEVENFDYIASDECRELRFFELDEALKEDLWPAVRKFLKEAKGLFGEF